MLKSYTTSILNKTCSSVDRQPFVSMQSMTTQQSTKVDIRKRIMIAYLFNEFGLLSWQSFRALSFETTTIIFPPYTFFVLFVPHRSRLCAWRTT